MKKLKLSLYLMGISLFGSLTLFAAPKPVAKENPAVSAAIPASIPAERNQNPVMDATAFSFGTGMYGNNGILGGALQIGVVDWLRLSGGLTGSLLGDQPSGSFALSNYSFLWQFMGGLMFTSTKIYKNIARPYTMLELTYFYDAKMKAGGLNGSFRIGVDLYMTQDYSIFIEGGVIAPFMREALAPAVIGGTFGLGARAYF
jgi:hypothetical protein